MFNGCSQQFKKVSISPYRLCVHEQLDFLIVITSTLDMALPIIMLAASGFSGEGAVDLSALRILRVFRILRALRPLRVIARAKGLQTLVRTFLSAAGPAANTFGIALAAWTVLAAVGMQFFQGKMYRCSDHTIQYRFPSSVESIHGQSLDAYDPGCSGVDGTGSPRAWINHSINFDNIVNGIHAMVLSQTKRQTTSHLMTSC